MLAVGTRGERLEGCCCRLDGLRAIDRPQGGGHTLAIFVGDEGQAVPHQVHDTGLNLGLRKDGRDRARESRELVNQRDQDILDAARAEFGQDAVLARISHEVS